MTSTNPPSRTLPLFIGRVGLLLAGLFVVWLLTWGVLYVSGYRVYRIPTGAMRPTINQGDYVIGRLSETYRDRIRRFDLVVYRLPQESGGVATKRVVGLPGERVTINAQGVKVNGAPLTLPPSVAMAGLGVQPCDIKVPGDAIFVLGDNPANSADSRYLGPVPKKDVIGYLVFRK